MVGGFVLWFATYILCRVGRDQQAAVLVTSFATITIFGVVLSGGDITDLHYLLLPVLVSGVLLPTEAVLLFIGIDVVAILFVPLVRRDVGWDTITLEALRFFLVGFALALFVSRFRDALEKLRLAELTKANAALEKEIAERGRAEAALRGSEERYRIVCELISDYAYSYHVEPDGTLTPDWITADAFTRVTGFTAEEIDARGTLALYHPDDAPAVSKDLEKVLAGQANSGRYRIITKSGERRWLHIYRRPVWDADQGRVVQFFGVAQDITAHKKAEEALEQAKATLEDEVRRQTDEIRRQHEELKAILHNVGDAIAILNPEGAVTYINPAFTALLGYEPDDIVGKHPGMLLIEDPALGTAVGQGMRQTDGQQIWHSELVVPCKDGSQCEAEIAFVLVPGADGEIVSMVASLRDIRRFKQLDRMKTRFMQTVSHELRTPLSNIGLYIRLLRSGKPERRESYLETLETETQRLSRITAKVLDATRFSDASAIEKWATLSVSEIIDKTVARFRSVADAKGFTLSVTPLAGQPAYVQGDLNWLMRALSELVENAITFTPAGGAVRVSARRVEEDGIPLIAIDVHDSGAGIESGVLAQILDYAFERGQVGDAGHVPGIGLGLTIVRLILARHGGRLAAASAAQPGRGSVFTMLLPIAPQV